MELYPRFLEAFLYLSIFYLFVRKQELIIIYLPLLFFTRNLIDEFVLRQLIWYFLVTVFLAFAAYRTNCLKRLNIAAVLIFVYFTILYIFSPSLSGSRSTYFSMSCLFLAFMIIPSLYVKFGRETISNELYKMSLCVLLLFAVNTLLSTATGYAPYQIYGRTTGVLYGAIGPTEFMLLPLALFIYLAHNVQRMSLVHVLFGFLTFVLILLSFRRTAQMASVIAVVAFLVLLVSQGDKKQIALTGSLIAIVAAAALMFTDLRDQFSERYESRFGDQEFVHAEEGRFTDHIMVYEDVFVYGRYSMLFGHSFFNSAGNYARGVRGDRSLHPDIPVLVHASGLIGLTLYLVMVGTAFSQSFRFAHGTHDKVVWLFCLGAFVVFTTSGRITEASYSLGFVALLHLPLAGPYHDEEVTQEETGWESPHTTARA